MTQDRFPRAFALLRVTEGGYANHPDDPGGATMKGITQRTYDAYRKRRGQHTRDVRKITDAEVETIYRNQYWNAVRADDLPGGVGYCVFDAAVNSGPGQAVEWLQQAIGAKVDGVVGDETISKTRGADPHRLIDTYCDMRLAFMKRLKHWSVFEDGWKRRVAEVRAQSKDWAAGVTPVVTQEKIQPKAEGPEKISATVKDMVKDPRALATAAGTIGSTGVMSQSEGPIPYAIAAVMVLGALAGIWWLMRGRRA